MAPRGRKSLSVATSTSSLKAKELEIEIEAEEEDTNETHGTSSTKETTVESVVSFDAHLFTPSKSTSRKYVKTPFNLPDTPTTKMRLQEREDLRELNSRLKQVVMLNQQNIKPSNNDEELIKTYILEAEKRAELQVETLNIQLNKLIAERDNALLAKTNASKKEVDLLNRINLLTEEAKASKSKLESQKENNKEVTDLTTANKALQAEISALKKQLKDLNSENSSLKGEIENNKALAAAKQSAFENEVKSKDAVIGDLNFQLKQKKTEFSSLSETNRTNISKFLEQSKQFEVRLSNSIAQALVDQQEAYEDEKTNLAKSLRVAHSEQIATYQAALEQLGHEKSHFESELKGRSTQFEAQVKESAELRTKLKRFEVSLSEATSTLKSELELKTSEASRISKMFTEMKETYRKKEIEFDQLMDVKVALSIELKSYNDLLVKEETRLGITATPSKKRKLATTMVEEETASPFMITSADLERHVVAIRNTTTDDANTSGWKLTNSHNRPAFDLPKHTISAGQTFYIYVCKKNEIDLTGSTELNIVANVNSDFFDTVNGDVVTLVKDKMKLTLKVFPDEFTTTSVSSDKVAKRCVIM